MNRTTTTKRTISSRHKTLLIAFAAAAALLSGCSDGSKWKEEAEKALSKQSEMKQYAFAGDADIDLGLSPPAKGSEPATATLVSLFSKSKLNWSGVSSTDPLRIEADFSFEPGAASGSASFGFPILVKEDLLYLRIPLLNKENEYFSFDLKKWNGTGGGLKPDNLKNANRAASEALKVLLSDMDAKWFKKAKEPLTLKDGKKGTVIRVDINEKNRKEISDHIKAKLPEAADSLKKNGLLTDSQADSVKNAAKGSFELSGPGEIKFITDDTGFIREEEIRLDYRTTGSDGKNAERHIHYRQSFDDINKSPKFKRQVPKTVRPFEEVLKQMPAAGK